MGNSILYIIGGIVVFLLGSFFIKFFMKSMFKKVGFDKNILSQMSENSASLLKPKSIPNGLPATATVVSCRQGNMKVSMGGVNQNYQLIIEVNVSNPQGETWQATMKEMINITQVSVFQPGVKFKVLYDSNDKSNVVSDRT